MLEHAVSCVCLILVLIGLMTNDSLPLACILISFFSAIENDWLEFFYPAMKPWVHYVPVSTGKSTISERLERFSLIALIAQKRRITVSRYWSSHDFLHAPTFIYFVVNIPSSLSSSLFSHDGNGRLTQFLPRQRRLRQENRPTWSQIHQGAFENGRRYRVLAGVVDAICQAVTMEACQIWVSYAYQEIKKMTTSR